MDKRLQSVLLVYNSGQVYAISISTAQVNTLQVKLHCIEVACNLRFICKRHDFNFHFIRVKRIKYRLKPDLT